MKHITLDDNREAASFLQEHGLLGRMIANAKMNVSINNPVTLVVSSIRNKEVIGAAFLWYNAEADSSELLVEMYIEVNGPSEAGEAENLIADSIEAIRARCGGNPLAN